MKMPVDVEDKDINDAFTDIFLSEEHLVHEGYEEGFERGVAEANTEAFHLGYHRGAELGAELGYYIGVVESLLAHADENCKNSRIAKNVKHLEALKASIESYLQQDYNKADIQALADNIRSAFKKICAVLKIDASYPETDKLSF